MARLIDANALSLIGVITHLNKQAKPWENVAVAVYFVQPENKQLPQYLTQVETPVYTTVKKRKGKLEDMLPDVFV